MKKILLLGGDYLLLPVIEAAHNLNCYVITCDYLPDNIAHKYSDEYHNISTTDKDSLLELAQKKNVDGLLTFTDSGALPVAFVCEKLGLPSPGPYKSVKILQNKALFRDFLSKHNFQVPRAKGYDSVTHALNEISIFNLPVMIKPVDSAGSKGVFKVDNINNLRRSIEEALQFSPSKHFIIEEYIESKGFPSDSDCFSINGKLVVPTFSDQRFDENAENPFAPVGFSWPSTMEKTHQQELTNEIQRLISLLDMKSSIYNVETRVGINNKPYIMELSPRGGGNRLAEMVRFATGIDMITGAVKAALGEEVIELNKPIYNGYWAELILHSNKSGVFQELVINETIRDFVIETNLWVKKGQFIDYFSGGNKAIGSIVLNFDSYNQLLELMNQENVNFEIIVK